MAEGYIAASSVGKSVTKTEWGFSRRDLEEWQKEKEPGKLQLEEPMYYSTTSGFDTDSGVTKRLLVEDDKANMKLLRADLIQPSLDPPLDLVEGKRRVTNFRSKERMDILLKGLIKHGVVGSSKFVCQRGLLVHVGLTPYSDVYKGDTAQKLAVEKIGSTIYMYMYPSDSTLTPNTGKFQSGPQKVGINKNQYTGFKFEQLLTQNAGESSDEVFDESLEFGALVKAKLGGHNFMISGEIDCVDEEGDLVELKTHMRDMNSVRQKERMRWWLQCHLLGVKSLVLGKHQHITSPSGTRSDCTAVKRYPLAPQLNIQVKDCNFTWKSETCLAAIHKFLSLVEENVISSGLEEARKLFVMRRNKGSQVFSFKESENEYDKFILPVDVQRLLKAESCVSTTGE